MKPSLLFPVLSLVLAGCGSSPDPVNDPANPVALSSKDTLRFAIEDSYSGRVMLAQWYHVSFSSPLAVRTLAERPGAQAFAVSGVRGAFALPASVDSLFDFDARMEKYLLDEVGRTDSAAVHDTALRYEHRRRWAFAPLVLGHTAELAGLTLAELGQGIKPSDDSVLQSEYLLFFVRDTVVADEDGLLRRRKLTGGFGPGWHLLRYQDSGRSLHPASLQDTVRFRPGIPKPNLV